MKENFSGFDTDDDTDSEVLKKDTRAAVKSKPRDLGVLAGLGGSERLIQKDRATEHETIWQRPKQEQDQESAGEDKHEEPAEDESQFIEDAMTERPVLTQEQATEYEDGEQDAIAEMEPEEAAAVAQQLVAQHRSELVNEQPVPGTEEEAANLSQTALHDKIQEKLRAEPTAPPERIVDEAAAEIKQAIDDEPAPEQDAESVPPFLATPDETVSQHMIQEENAAEDDATVPPPTTPPGPPSTGPPSQPPLPPIPGYGGGGPAISGPNIPAPTYQAPRPRANVEPTVPDMISAADSSYYERQAMNRGLLVGGIVGYLIGRRRGRIKTERRLEGVQRKLEKQVKSFDSKLTAKEQEISILTTENFRASNDVQRQELLTRVKPNVPERIPAARPNRTPRTVEMPGPAAELAVPFVAAPVLERAPSQQEVLPPAAVRLAQEMPRPTEQVRQSAEQVTKATQAVERLEHLNTQQLLDVSEKVVIDGTPLRQIFEAKQITEPGLRHILTEYVRGGDVKQALTQELALKEMTYEHDPQIRDRIAATMAATAAGSTAQSDNPVGQVSKLTTAKARASEIRQQIAERTASANQSKLPDPLQQTLIRTWVAVVIVLAIIALILLIR